MVLRLSVGLMEPIFTLPNNEEETDDVAADTSNEKVWSIQEQ